jgi:hypothetical protein
VWLVQLQRRYLFLLIIIGWNFDNY